jgi:hypothetical protein
MPPSQHLECSRVLTTGLLGDGREKNRRRGRVTNRPFKYRARSINASDEPEVSEIEDKGDRNRNYSLASAFCKVGDCTTNGGRVRSLKQRLGGTEQVRRT